MFMQFGTDYYGLVGRCFCMRLVWKYSDTAMYAVCQATTNSIVYSGGPGPVYGELLQSALRGFEEKNCYTKSNEQIKNQVNVNNTSLSATEAATFWKTKQRQCFMVYRGKIVRHSVT